ncbi:MAG: PhnE/PtxC family ABC transporter permease [Planctomycetota bacterium]
MTPAAAAAAGRATLPAKPGGGFWRLPVTLAVLVALAVLVLPLDLSALSSVDELGLSWQRLWRYLAAFGSPDLSAGMLARCGRLAVDTVSVALLGTAIGIVLAYPLALGASRAVMLPATDRFHGWRATIASLPLRLFVELCRLILDGLRGVPDFVWAVLFANVLGTSPITGMVAIAVSVAGIFGKVLSEQWDQVPEERYRAVRSTGGGRLATFAYGLQPLAARTTLSFVLMRTECAVRNASVIGVVGGGGLGAALWDEYTDGRYAGVATVLLALLAVTALADLGANLVRRRLRIDPNHPRAGSRSVGVAAAKRRRRQVLLAVGLLLAGCLAWLLPELRLVLGELRRIEWGFVEPYTLGLFRPDLSLQSVTDVGRAALVPLAIGVLATVAGALLAAALVYPASIAFQLDASRFTGERISSGVRALRVVAFAVARALALVLRGVPEVAWLVVLAVVLRQGVAPCIVAISLHTAGVLHRVFTESVDDVRYQALERVDAGASRIQRFAVGALPRVWPTWRAYAFFQFEVNVRAGAALGLVGAGGLGHLFQANLAFREHDRAAAFLWGMIVLTIAIDRVSRWLQVRRLKC